MASLPALRPQRTFHKALHLQTPWLWTNEELPRSHQLLALPGSGLTLRVAHWTKSARLEGKLLLLKSSG